MAKICLMCELEKEGIAFEIINGFFVMVYADCGHPVKPHHIPNKRWDILRRHNFTCQYCGRKAPDVALEVDHIYPRSKGGTEDSDNLTVACLNCNREKRDKII